MVQVLGLQSTGGGILSWTIPNSPAAVPRFTSMLDAVSLRFTVGDAFKSIS